MTEPIQGLSHVPATSAEERADGSVAFMAICTCGWRGDDHDDELPADLDRWQHVDDFDQASDGSWVSQS